MLKLSSGVLLAIGILVYKCVSRKEVDNNSKNLNKVQGAVNCRIVKLTGQPKIVWRRFLY